MNKTFQYRLIESELTADMPFATLEAEYSCYEGKVRLFQISLSPTLLKYLKDPASLVERIEAAAVAKEHGRVVA